MAIVWKGVFPALTTKFTTKDELDAYIIHEDISDDDSTDDLDEDVIEYIDENDNMIGYEKSNNNNNDMKGGKQSNPFGGQRSNPLANLEGFSYCELYFNNKYDYFRLIIDYVNPNYLDTDNDQISYYCSRLQ